MAQVPFHYLELRTFCYATEDEQRVHQAVGRLVPEDAELERDLTEGHHGDPIVILTATLERASDMHAVLEELPGVPGFDRVVTDLEEYVDEDCSFYLRLDKQRAFQDELAIGDGIHLRGKVEAYPATQEAAIENLRDAFQAFIEEYHDQPESGPSD